MDAGEVDEVIAKLSKLIALTADEIERAKFTDDHGLFMADFDHLRREESR